MFGWHHRFNGHEFEPTLLDSEGQGSLVCCSPGVYKVSDTTELLNNINEDERRGINRTKRLLRGVND